MNRKHRILFGRFKQDRQFLTLPIKIPNFLGRPAHCLVNRRADYVIRPLLITPISLNIPPGATQPIVGVYFTALYRVLASSLTRLLDHIQRRATVGRTLLNELSVRRRDLYLTKHNTYNR